MGTIPPGSIIDAGSSLLNTAATIFTNKSQRKYNEKMYQRQRTDSLADWAMQNEYNSPASQMERLRQAGLNPNLVYGKGADNTGGAVRSSDTGSYKPEAPEIKFSAKDSLLASNNLKMMQAQTDNLKVQNTVLAQEKLLKEAQTQATLANAGLSNFDLTMKTDLKDTDMTYRKEQLRKLQADTEFTLDSNERAAAANASNLREAAQRILNYRLGRAKTQEEIIHIKQQVENLKKSGLLLDWEVLLSKENVTKGDAIYWRVLADLLKGNGIKSIDRPRTLDDPDTKKIQMDLRKRFLNRDSLNNPIK